jgi:hypothetical protein
MLQKYVRNILVVLVLCCNKYFHVATCKCFIWMLYIFHTHVANVYSKCFICSDICCIQVFYVVIVSYFIGMFRESWGHGPGVEGSGAMSRGPVNGARGVPRVLRMGRAGPYLGSRVPPARR